MTYDGNQQSKKTAPARRLFAAALVLGCAFGAVNKAAAQGFTTPGSTTPGFTTPNIASPVTPTKITPPAGSSAFLLGRGVGTQGYVCLPTATGASWTVNQPRPEATLFTTIFGQNIEIITHFLSPNTNPNDFAPKPVAFGNATWQSSLDSSMVWAQAVNSINAGSDASCPNDGAIGCLLLQVIGAQQGPTGGKALTQTTFIQRLNTKGGSAPADGCLVAGDVSKQTLVPYSADYYFFRGGVK